MQQKEFFGFGSLDNLEKILKKERMKNVFLVTGKKSFRLSGAKQKLDAIFKKTNTIFKRFYDFSPNPQLNETKKAISLFEKEKYDGVVAIGGGSSIDVAKAIKLSFIKKHPNKTNPLIAIPTTAGSGSEATYFIVYYKENEKQSKGDPQLTLPDYSICDPQLTFSLPKKIAASTGIDALSQAIESYWSVNSTEKSKKLATRSIKLLLGNLEKAVNNPCKNSKENVMKAANLAGKAINITQTTACHSIAYPITSYFKIPHGHAVGLSLGEILVYNFEITEKNCLDKRGAEYVKKTIRELTNMVGVKEPHEAKEKINELMNNIGLETKLSKLNIVKKNINLIVEKGFAPERVKNNPRLLTRKNLFRILNKLY